MSSQIKNLTKKIVINAYKTKLEKEMRQKMAKKGVLIKMIEANSKRTKCLSDILKESDNLNILSNNKTSQNDTNEKMSDADIMKKYRNTPKGGPKHSIAVNRAHHLSNFLTEYIINSFQSGRYEKPIIPDHLNKKTDSNGYVKEAYVFELSNVELQPNLNFIRIHWLCSDDEQINEYVENYLEKSLKVQIRNNLVSERVMSYVPQVLFVRDNTNVLFKQLDEHLMKIKLENEMNESDEKQNDQNEHNENYREDIKDETVKKVERIDDKINNLYGVDFNRLIESIKSTSYTPKQLPWSSNTNLEQSNKNDNAIELSSNDNNNNSLNPIDVVNEANKSKFLVSLKAYQINKRMKNERRAKSTLNKLNQLEYEMLRNENNLD